MKKMFESGILKVLLGIVGVISALVVVLGAGYLKAPPADLSLGAIPGNEVQGDVLIVGGLEKAYVRRAFTATSSVLCSIRNPFFGATSTIESFSAVFSRGVLGANLFDVSTTSNTLGYGSSSPALIAAHNIPSTDKPVIVFQKNASTTSSVNTGNDGGTVLAGLNASTGLTGISNYILGPREFLTMRLSTSTIRGEFAAPYQGTCTAEFKRIGY